MTRAVVVCAAAALVGCASTGPSTLPVVETVCIRLVGLQDHEVALVMRKAAQYLSEYKFQLADAGCGAVATYTRFASTQFETVRPGWIPFTVARGAYWSHEGGLTYSRAGIPNDIQDQQVALRGYESAQDLFDALAWQIVRPATWLYQPRLAPK